MSALLRLVLVLAAVLAGARVHAQQVVVRAEVESRTVRPDGIVNYAVTVAGEGTALVPTPDAPPTVGLALVDPYPTTQSDLTIINGEARQSVVFRWAFRPMRSGRAVIGPTRVRAGNRTVRTESIDVTVEPGLSAQPMPGNQPRASPPGSTPNTTASEDVFVRATPSQTSAWQGEQVVVEYRLYYNPNLGLSPDLTQVGAWDTEGFWREELVHNTDRHPSLVTLGGRRYMSLVIKRVALYATRSGVLSVSPFEIAGRAFAPAGAVAGGIVRLRDRVMEVKTSAPAFDLTIRPLPGGAPASFGGAVGSFRMDVSTGQTALETGETTTVDVTVSGDGNLATLAAPSFDAPSGVEVFPPRVETDVVRTGPRAAGRKTFAYRAMPLAPGDHALPAVAFTYFNPETGRYATLHGGGATLRATGAPVARAAAAAADSLPNPVANPDLRVRQPAVPLHRKTWPYVLLGVPMLALLLLAGLRHAPVRRPSVRRREEAVDALADARMLANGSDVPAFYHALAHALERAAEASVGRSVRGLTRDELADALAEKPSSVRDRLLNVLHRADLARFAGLLPNAAQRRDDLAAADRLLADLAPPPDKRAAVALVLVPLLLALLGSPAATAQPSDSLARVYRAAVETRNPDALRAVVVATDAPDALAALGLVAAHRSDAATAVWALERAQHLVPTDTLAPRALTIVRRRTGLDSLALPLPSPTTQMWTAFIRRIPAIGTFGLGAALCWIAAAAAALHLRRRLTAERTRLAVLATLPAGVVLVLLAFAASAGLGVPHASVVRIPQSVREQPSDGAPAVATLPPGALVEPVEGGTTSWARVRTGDRREGFIPASALVPVDRPYGEAWHETPPGAFDPP